jgi:putative CocE/NonD family hydrolase
MRDGTVLRADVFRPAAGSWPVLLQRTPYGKQSRLGTLFTLDPVNAAAAGFAVVVQDVRGRFASEGEFRPFDENTDGFDSVEWCAVQPWSTGRVGMFGASYLAATQWHAAVTAPPHLGAVCPVQASSDYYEGRSYRGGAFEFGALLGIALNALGQGSIARVDPGGGRRRELWSAAHQMLADVGRTGRSLPLSGLRNTVAGEIAPFLLEWMEHCDEDDYWRRLSIKSRLADADVPALHISSWFDQYLVGTLANYEGMRAGPSASRDEQRLLIGPWNHYPARTGVMGSARVGDLDFGLGAIINTDLLQLRWFGRYLADDERPLPLMRSRVRLFVMGANVWRDEDEWPLARAVSEVVYLDSDGHANSSAGDGRLTRDEPGARPPDRFEFDPRPADGRHRAGPGRALGQLNRAVHRLHRTTRRRPPRRTRDLRVRRHPPRALARQRRRDERRAGRDHHRARTGEPGISGRPCIAPRHLEQQLPALRPQPEYRRAQLR